jgi:hypothetical protein
MMGPGFADELARGIGCSLMFFAAGLLISGFILGAWLA